MIMSGKVHNKCVRTVYSSDSAISVLIYQQLALDCSSDNEIRLVKLLVAFPKKFFSDLFVWWVAVL